MNAMTDDAADDVIDLIGYEHRHAVVETAQLVWSNGGLECFRVCEQINHKRKPPKHRHRRLVSTYDR